MTTTCYSYRNPIYNSFGSIDCEVEHPVYGWIPFTACAEDCEEQGRNLYAKIMADGDIAPYVPDSEPTTEELAAAVLLERDYKLRQSDWSQLLDTPDETRASWGVYRQGLRDLPLQVGFPHEFVWPEEP